MTIGEKIKALREQKKMTQEELGRFINSTKQTIFKYETGIITNIPFDKLQTIASVLGCSPAYLMGWTDDPQGHTNEEALTIPEQFKDVMVAFQNGAENLTQQDVDAVVQFIEFLKNKNK